MKEKREVSVAIQGGFGAFHEIAAKEFFKNQDVEIIPCDTFADLFEVLQEHRADCGIVAVENSVAGSLLSNHSLINDSNLPVVGEHYLRIVQNLLALPGERIEDIKEIHSHPVAIMQCNTFLNELRKKGVKVVDSLDTALSAKRIRDEHLRGTGALAGDLAAEMYGLDILRAGVESNKRNFTRFIIIAASEKVKDILNLTGETVNKSSLCFSLPHLQGKLSHVLSVLSIYGMNLTKIQSLPIVGREWEYLFYTDLVFDNYSIYLKAIEAIKPITENLRVLGEYRQGQRPD
ncbi:MAG: prephenate dehydratase [Bacteroidales bacterium]|jgi:prephenate dehydratase|nr:prephenate dehydratase [Bacteroidales bacterium]